MRIADFVVLALMIESLIICFSSKIDDRFKDSQLFREIFNHIVILCIQNVIVTGENVVSDGSFIPGNVSANSKKEVVRQVEKSSMKYLDALELI